VRLIRSILSNRPRWAEVDDRELLAGLARSDESALDELVARKTQALLHMVVRMVGDEEEARDVVQVTFLRLWENRDKYDPQWAPNTWIYRIASNLAIDHIRARRTRDAGEEPLTHHLRQIGGGEEAPRGLDRLQHRELERIFRELCADLSEKQRMAFILREIEGLESDEVAAILGCRASTVRNHVFSARRTLRAALEVRYPEYLPPDREVHS
jgi:RNA polymerase sigma-70 factor (ECF subfamily)